VVHPGAHRAERNEVMQTLRDARPEPHSHFVGKPNDKGVVEVWRDTKVVFSAPRAELHSSLGRRELAHCP
jgi:phosphoribosylformylglycinamidine synthase